MAAFVLVHGRNTGGWVWKRVAPVLRSKGHEVYVPTLTGLGERSHLTGRGVDLETHIEDVSALLRYEDLTNVILVGQTAAGPVITGVADRLPERVVQLVYLEGILSQDGQAIVDFMPPEHRLAWQELVDREGDGWLFPIERMDAPFEALGIQDQRDLHWWRSRRVPQPAATFTQPLRLRNPEALGAIKRSFIACNGWSGGLQKQHADRARTEPGWRYYEIAAGHAPTIGAPLEVAEVLLRIAA